MPAVRSEPSASRTHSPYNIEAIINSIERGEHHYIDVDEWEPPAAPQTVDDNSMVDDDDAKVEVHIAPAAPIEPAVPIAPAVPVTVVAAAENEMPPVGITGCLYHRDHSRRHKIVLPPAEDDEEGLPDVQGFWGPHREVYIAKVLLNRQTPEERLFVVAGWTRDRMFPRNVAMRAICPSIIWRGDVTVFAAGKRVPFLSNPMSIKKEVIDKAIRIFISQMVDALDGGRIPPARMSG